MEEPNWADVAYRPEGMLVDAQLYVTAIWPPRACD